MKKFKYIWAIEGLTGPKFTGIAEWIPVAIQMPNVLLVAYGDTRALARKAVQRQRRRLDFLKRLGFFTKFRIRNYHRSI
jgi:hypothetical protein